jgi:aerobic-type carbon monoxide dehydrogenase small subunit (CoxS/CutS family)
LAAHLAAGISSDHLAVDSTKQAAVVENDTSVLPRRSRLDSLVATIEDGTSEAALREAAMDYQITLNGTSRAVSARPDTPLLYVLTNELNLKGPRFGCGLAQCGSCSVLLDGVEIRSCITPVGDVQGKALTTLEGLPALYAQQKGLAAAPAMHPLQQAFIEVQAPQCGYCYNGMTIKASELLAQNPKPTEAQIRAHMDGHLCRCGTYPRVMKAIQLASTRMAGDVR